MKGSTDFVLLGLVSLFIYLAHLLTEHVAVSARTLPVPPPLALLNNEELMLTVRQNI